MGTIRIRLGLLASMAALMCANRLYAGDFFGVTATGSNGTVVNVTGSNVLELSRNLINEENQFSALKGQNVIGKLSYGGIPNALIFSQNAAQSQVTLSIPITGFSKTYTTTGSSSLENQIVDDFIKSNGDQNYARFLEAVDRMSAVATIDGNPQASTALIADDVFDRFGIQNTLSQGPKLSDNDQQFSISGTGGVIHSDGLNGDWADANINTAWRFSDHVALSLGTAIDYRTEAESDSYTIAEEVGLPITIINNRGDGLSWQATPWAFGGISASYDQADGTVLVGGGGTSSLGLHMGDFTVRLADQIGYASNAPVSVDGYAFEVNVNQWILKNGLGLGYQPHGVPFFVDASVAYSNFLRPAAVPDYWTPSVGVGIDFTRYSGIRVGYTGDFAPRYNASGGEISLFLAY